MEPPPELGRSAPHAALLHAHLLHAHRNGNGFIEDEEGTELPDEATARINAIAAARDLMASDLRGGELDLTSLIEVEDEAHKSLFTIRFADAVRLTAKH